MGKDEEVRKLKRLVFKILKELGVFYKWKKNLFIQYDMTTIGNKFRRLDFFSKYIIDRSLYWSDTIEGHNYWDEIDNKFRKIYDIEINKINIK